jgi:thymidylate synthase (FAD) (EC 2.1.1.148)
MAQITRHRHASFDVQSMRYVEFDEEDPEPGDVYVHIPELDEAHIAGRNAEIADEYKGESDEELLDRRRERYHESIDDSFDAYNELLDLGVAPENARMVLPIGTKVNMVVSLNARMLMHVADIRSAADAQWEVREMTNQILELAGEWCPLTFEYYNEEMKGRKNKLAP